MGQSLGSISIQLSLQLSDLGKGRVGAIADLQVFNCFNHFIQHNDRYLWKMMQRTVVC